MNTHTIQLTGGYRGRDQKGAPGRSVTYGRRPTVGDRIKIDADPLSSVEVQQALMYVRAAITAFEGVARVPVLLSVLLSLDDTDREELLDGYIEFMNLTRGGRAAERVDENTFALAMGLEVDGEVYDLVEFTPEPSPLSGNEEVKLEREYGSGVRKDLALVSREAVALAQSEGALRIEGAVAVETLERLDAYDGGQLVQFMGERRDSFRKKRRASALAGK